jgi:hypothetical protein
MADKPKKDAKPAKGGGGPAFEIGGIGRGVKLLVLWCLPVIGLLTWCLVRWNDGPHLRHSLGQDEWLLVGRALGGAGLAAVAVWLVLPLGHWLRLYPIARFVDGSKAVWFLPMLVAFPLWLACYVAVPAIIGFGGWVAWGALHTLGLVQRWHALF